jgi:hypothetical protein
MNNRCYRRCPSPRVLATPAPMKGGHAERALDVCGNTKRQWGKARERSRVAH